MTTGAEPDVVKAEKREHLRQVMGAQIQGPTAIMHRPETTPTESVPSRGEFP